MAKSSTKTAQKKYKRSTKITLYFGGVFREKLFPCINFLGTDAARSGQIWGPISQIWLVFQMWRSCFQIWPDLARSGNLGNFFFQKKKKTPQIWPDLEIWPVFFFPQISGYCLPGKGTLEFFFSPLKRANFDDLRPFKAKFGTFEHLWGSKTWFCEPEISWFLPTTSRFLKNLEKKNFFFPGKF